MFKSPGKLCLSNSSHTHKYNIVWRRKKKNPKTFFYPFSSKKWPFFRVKELIKYSLHHLGSQKGSCHFRSLSYFRKAKAEKELVFTLQEVRPESSSLSSSTLISLGRSASNKTKMLKWVRKWVLCLSLFHPTHLSKKEIEQSSDFESSNRNFFSVHKSSQEW